MPSPMIVFTSGRFLNRNSGVIAEASKMRPLTLRKRNGKNVKKGEWMHIETEVFYSMVRSETHRLNPNDALVIRFTDDGKGLSGRR